MYLNNRGSTVINVLISAALIAILALSMAEIVINFMKGERSARQTAEATNLIYEILGTLKNPSACINSLGGKNPKSFTSITETKPLRIRFCLTQATRTNLEP